jgi:hypothetical protein
MLETSHLPIVHPILRLTPQRVALDDTTLTMAMTASPMTTGTIQKVPDRLRYTPSFQCLLVFADLTPKVDCYWQMSG